MKQGKEVYEKEGVKMDMGTFICDCGRTLGFRGQTGCVIDDHYAYFYQCPECKMIEITDCPAHIDSGMNSRESLLEAGWNRLV